MSAVSRAAVLNDLERLKGASLGGFDASPVRTAIRNIIAACRNSPLALAAYCREGVVPLLANALAQARDASHPVEPRPSSRCSPPPSVTLMEPAAARPRPACSREWPRSLAPQTARPPPRNRGTLPPPLCAPAPAPARPFPPLRTSTPAFT